MKKKISLTVDPKFYSELKKLQKAKGKPSLSATVIQLTKDAMELEEDIYFGKIASKRINDTKIPHDVFWKKRKI